MNANLLILFLGVLLSLICVAFVLQGRSGTHTKVGRRADALRKRGPYAGGGTGQAKAKGGAQTGSLKRDDYGGSSRLDRLARRFLPRPEVLDQRLRRTGAKIRVGRYIAFNLLLTAFVSLILVFILKLSPWLAVAAGTISGLGIPHLMINRMIDKRLEKFTALFPDAIDLIVRGLRSGLPVTESISAVGHEMPDPVGGEFRRIAESVKLGRTLEDALWNTANRLDTPDFKFFVISLSVQRETGGNLAETLANLSDILRRRRQMRLKIKAMSSEARASALILGSLPFIMFGIIFLMNPGYEMDLFNDPRGRIMLGVGLVTMTIGILVMRKMVRFEI
jgi:tight adherence protein B